MVISESGYGTAPHSQIDPHDNQASFESPMLPPSMGRHPSQQGDFSLFPSGDGSDEFAGIGGQLADPSVGRSDRHVGFYESDGDIGNGLSVLSAMAASRRPLSPNDTVMQTSLDPYNNTTGALFDGFHATDAGQLVASQAQWSQHSLGPSSKRVESGAALEDQNAKHPDGDLVCSHQGCGKRKKRDCDLKKHMKRHSRPYGCTFPNCWKRFGSRNDWKRHENSQHFLQEMWRCDIQISPGRKCGKLLYHKSIFHAHFRRKHADLLKQQMPVSGPSASIEEQQLEQKANSVHLGREGNIRFWCGFCNELVPQREGTHNAWEQRFNHIGDHFDKDHLHIDSWICIEENKQKGLISKDERKKAKQRSRMGRPDEDSDLGESGIVEPSPFGPGYTAPGAFAPPGHGPDMSAQGGMYTSNKRRRIEDDMDADGVSDDDGWR
ncbi:hypothetical protein LTR85_008454 [Meristemomyces frigidus]|nr:hypothetical protein LTR85_008454 [Meristemomyces frigidus]